MSQPHGEAGPDSERVVFANKLRELIKRARRRPKDLVDDLVLRGVKPETAAAWLLQHGSAHLPEPNNMDRLCSLLDEWLPGSGTELALVRGQVWPPIGTNSGIQPTGNFTSSREQSANSEPNRRVPVAERTGNKDSVAPPNLAGLSTDAQTPVMDQQSLKRTGRLEPKDFKWIVTLVGDSRHGFFGEAIRGITDTFSAFSNRDAMLNTVVCSHDDRADLEELYLHMFLDMPASGLILAATSATPSRVLLEAFVERGAPIVQIDRKLADLTTPWVGIDNFSAAYAAASHLLQHGHSRFAIIGGRPEVSTNQRRFEGFTKATQEAGCADENLVLWHCSHWDSSRSLIKTLLSRRDPPTAFFCLNGMASLGALLAFKESRLNCPQEVALIGFDDNPWCLASDPELTVISQPARLIGEQCAELMWEALHGRAIKGDYYLPWELIVRRSCGCM